MILEKGNKKLINAWATYDWANSAYNLVITATIFPIYYKSVTPDVVKVFGWEYKNTSLYDYAIAFAYMLIASIIPLLSGIADYGGSKKKFMQFFCYLGSISCLLMFFFTSENYLFGLLLAIIACVGYSGSLVFYNAYLPEIAKPVQQDGVSARGFAYGYIGSSVLLILNLVMIQNPHWFGISDQTMATRISFITVGVWWFAFAQIPFYHLPNNIYNKKTEGRYLLNGYKELRKVWRDIKANKNLTKYLTAFFVYSMGVQTIMLVATHFGSEEIKMESGQLIATILIIQFLAILGAYLFSMASKKISNISALKGATIIWSLICLATYFFVYTPMHFFFAAGAVGLVMGGIQSLSRSTYSKMLPETEDPSSYFSFYDIAEKFSIVCGMLTFGFITEFTSTLRTPIIALISFFIIGFLLLLRVPKINAD